ncbi:hypothetical protein, partial [Ochrobactrum sp. SFR4]|uniref:hypothetical protein n=1 Tax=Ochrobactrum sp. SFR4 TaxID=2717368 RepID=UPI001C8B4EA5
MEKLSPLERELLLSVSGLKIGIDKEITALKSFLQNSEASGSSSTMKRLSDIEKAQVQLNERMNSLRKDISIVVETLTDNLKSL